MPAELHLPPPTRLPPSWHDRLAEVGSALAATGYQREGQHISVAGSWLVLSEPLNTPCEFTLSSSLNQVGLWKWTQNGTGLHRVFEIPSWAILGATDEDRFADHELASLENLLDWAQVSRSGRIPSGWKPPARDLVESWLSRGALTVQTDGLVRQGELILQPDRWALRIPILPQLPANLTESRHHALNELCFDAQSRWAMVRFGVSTEANRRTLFAEVDFTGAPHSELLFSAGLDVLRHVVAWLVETADVLAETSVVIESLSLDCNQNKPNERIEP